MGLTNSAGEINHLFLGRFHDSIFLLMTEFNTRTWMTLLIYLRILFGLLNKSSKLVLFTLVLCNLLISLFKLSLCF